MWCNDHFKWRLCAECIHAVTADRLLRASSCLHRCSSSISSSSLIRIITEHTAVVTVERLTTGWISNLNLTYSTSQILKVSGRFFHIRHNEAGRYSMDGNSGAGSLAGSCCRRVLLAGQRSKSNRLRLLLGTCK